MPDHPAIAGNEPTTVDSHSDILASGQPATTQDGLECRLVRESGRDTWFVTNRTGGPLQELAVPRASSVDVRRVVVNAEPVPWGEDDEQVTAQLEQPLRPGQGTIVVVHYR